MILTTRKIAKTPKNPKHDRRFSNVKLFGKKTLALALALTMVLSLCSFTAFADGTLTISGADKIVGVGNEITLTANNVPEGKTVTWESKNTSVATVSENGVVTAVAEGSAEIRAKYTPDGEGAQDVVASHTVTVEIPVSEVSLGKETTAQMYIGTNKQLQAVVKPDNATNKSVTWSSSNSSVAEVSSDGKVTAKAPGTAVIRAISVYDNSKKGELNVTVSTDTVSSAQLASGESGTKSVSYGTSSSKVLDELKKVKIDAAYTQGGHLTVTAEDWQCATSYVPTTLGTYTFTSATYNVSVNVTVAAGVVKSSSVSPSQITVSKNTQANAIGLPASATVTLENGHSLDITVGSGDKVDYAWVCSNYNPTVTGAYTFTATRKSGTDPRFTMDAAKAPKVTVTVADYIPVNKATTSMAYTRTNVSVDLTSTIETAVNAKIRERMGSSYNARTTIESVVLSGSNSYGVMGTGSNKAVFTVTKTLPSSGTATQDFTYVALGNDGQKYTGTVTLTIYSGTFDVSDATSTSDPIVYFSGSNGIANKIADAFKARYGSTPTYIEFGSIGRNDDELGELRDGNGDSVEDGTYTFSSKDEDYDSVANIYFVPTGVGGTFDIEYTAYSGSSKRSSSMTGTISIKCDEMLVVWLSDMGAGETQNLSASAIQEQVTEILDTNKISYTLDTVSLNRPSTGTIYDGNNKKITTKTVDAEDLDDYTYEAPAKVTSANLVTIRFSVKCKSDSGRSSKTASASGVMLFNLTKKADITITAPANDAAVLGTDVFQTYFEKNASSTYRKNYDACYVVFSGAPNSNTSGYLYDGYKSGIINGSKIKSPNGKKFALTDISAYDKNAYDLSNTYYVPGSRNCTGGTFEIYGVKSGTTIKSSTRFTKLCEGSIDYVVGSAAAAITGTINASNYMQMTPSAFTKSNKNASYVVFTAQPAGGKLVYNYNRTTPGVVKEISLNTPYYITYSAANANYYLGYVSFVPAYTAVKGVTSVVDIPCTIYSTSKVGTACSVKISVVSATKSAKFTDVGVAYMPYADSIDFLYNCGITTGTSTTGSLYNPSGSVTRGEWITMLYRAAGSPKMSNKIPFTDVTAKNSYSWCYDAVRWAYQNNICQGTGATTFSPAMKLDRQQIVTFMYNYAVKYNGGNGAGSSINGYTDSASVASWAKAPMEWAVKNQYYTVIGTRLQPTDSANRAEVALYMHRLLTY